MRQLIIPPPPPTPPESHRERGPRSFNSQPSAPVPTHLNPLPLCQPPAPPKRLLQPHLTKPAHPAAPQVGQQLSPSWRAEHQSIGSKGLPHVQATAQYLRSMINPLQQKEMVALNCTHHLVWVLKRQHGSTFVLSFETGNWEEVGLWGIWSGSESRCRN